MITIIIIKLSTLALPNLGSCLQPCSMQSMGFVIGPCHLSFYLTQLKPRVVGGPFVRNDRCGVSLMSLR